MNQRGAAVLLLTAALSASPSAMASRPTARQEILAYYQRYVAAMKRIDPKPAEAILAPGFRSIGEAGKTMSRSELIQFMRTDMSHWRTVHSWSLKVLRLDIKRSSATAVMRERASLTVVDGYGAPHIVDIDATSEDTWTSTPKGWKILRGRFIRGGSHVRGGAPGV